MTSADREKLTDQLVRHEGLKLKPYTDTLGILTIGVGRNLEDRGISVAEAYVLLANDIAECEAVLTAQYPWFRTLDGMRQRVWIDLCFNMGITRLRGFVKAATAMAGGDYQQAATELVDSKWYTQVGTRGPWLVQALRTGHEPAGDGLS